MACSQLAPDDVSGGVNAVLQIKGVGIKPVRAENAVGAFRIVTQAAEEAAVLKRTAKAGRELEATHWIILGARLWGGQCTSEHSAKNEVRKHIGQDTRISSLCDYCT
jgi:hypothetical protein